jgi:hypothetical protein
MEERTTRIAGLLREAAETHHVVFRIVDGTDPDWASWYSHWLVHLSELPELVGSDLVPSEVTYLLVKLDREFTEAGHTDGWEEFYAHGFLKHFAR